MSNGIIQTGLPISKLTPLSNDNLSGNDYFVISKANSKDIYQTYRCDVSAIANVISSGIYQYTINNLPTEQALSIESLCATIEGILSKIPEEADKDNKLADKNFVNSSIQTNTAEYKGIYDELSALSDVQADRNDYAYVTEKTLSGVISAYVRYKYNETEEKWIKEYTINNSGFTSEQWNAINSGITDEDVKRIPAKDKTYLTTDHLDKETIIYEDGKVKVGEVISNDIDSRIKRSELKCEEWKFYMKDSNTPKIFRVVLSCD